MLAQNLSVYESEETEDIRAEIFNAQHLSRAGLEARGVSVGAEP